MKQCLARKLFLATGAAACLNPATSIAQASPQVVPTVYEAGHFFAVPETQDGERLKLLVDTGGGGGSGMYWISEAAARRLHLKTAGCTVNGEHLPVRALPEYRIGFALPAPGPGPCAGTVLVVSTSAGMDSDGQIGAGFLPGRVWTFNYPAHTLTLEGAGWRAGPGAQRTPLGFPHDARGKQGSGFPRITIHVDNQPLDMLLDTGATAYPTTAAARLSGTPTVNGEGVTSYITTEVLSRWHKDHPDWRVLEKADAKLALTPLNLIIEVPRVEVAGWSVGPVWFTERPDTVFHDYMAQMMDKPVEGALGGNVLRHFVMTVDYPHEAAYFDCADGCERLPNVD